MKLVHSGKQQTHYPMMSSNSWSAYIPANLKAHLSLALIFSICIMLLTPLSCRNANGDSQSPLEAKPITFSCNSLPTRFQSYNEAKAAVKNATFQIADAVETTKSSWIRAASYYSCDGTAGYFLLATDKNEYLFEGMPLKVWEGFKGADSFGEYYNAYIRDRYYMYVGQR